MARSVMEEQTVTTKPIVQGPMASQVAIKMLGHERRRRYVNANGGAWQLE